MATVTVQEGLQDPGGGQSKPTAEIQAEINRMDQKLNTKNFDVKQVLDSDLYKINMSVLNEPRLAENIKFKNIVARLKSFYILSEKFRAVGPTPQQLEAFKKSGYPFSYHVEMHKCLRNLILKVINQKNDKLQLVYLKEVYSWLITKLKTMGLLTKRQEQQEDQILNPYIVKMGQQIHSMIRDKMQSFLISEEETAEWYRQMFEDNGFLLAERTMLKDIPPANERIQNIQHKTFPQFQQVVQEIKSRDEEMLQKKRLNNSCHTPGLVFAKMGNIYDVKTEEKTQKRPGTAIDNYQNKHFETTERAIRKQPYETFYTVNMSTNKPQSVQFQDQNRFEGRSAYFNYYPTGGVVEQRLEAIWFENQNKKLQEKRSHEETKSTMNQWAQARSRMEAEIQRKKEHSNFATNFEKARGFVRTQWKSKNFNPNDDPTAVDSSTDDSELAQIEKNEKFDSVSEESSPQHQKSIKKKLSLDREPVNQLVDLSAMDENPSCQLSVQASLETLNAIQAYNSKLSKKRKAKDTLSEISTSNITATYTQKRDRKKKTVSLVTNYKTVGIIDGCQPSTISLDKFSYINKQNEIQRSASALRINKLRKQYDSWIQISPKNQIAGEPPVVSEKTDVDNPFIDGKNNHISLSVYNGPSVMAARKPRPLTTQDQLLRRLPGYKVPVAKAEIGADGEPIPVAVSAEPVALRESILPQINDISEMLTKDAIDQYRQEQMLEVYSIKERLAHDGCPINLKAIKRALLIPQEPIRVPGSYQYPNPVTTLMVNPFPKKTKKKGKKKKKR